MNTQRHINKDLLRFLIGEYGVERLAVMAGCSSSLLQKLISDKCDKVPSLRIIDGLCASTNHSLNDLFPIVEIKEEAS